MLARDYLEKTDAGRAMRSCLLEMKVTKKKTYIDILISKNELVKFIIKHLLFRAPSFTMFIVWSSLSLLSAA